MRKLVLIISNTGTEQLDETGDFTFIYNLTKYETHCLHKCVQGSYGQGKSGKTERVREKSGNFKIPLTRPIINALFSQFLPASGGLCPQTPTGAPPQTLQVSLYCNILQWNKI